MSSPLKAFIGAEGPAAPLAVLEDIMVILKWWVVGGVVVFEEDQRPLYAMLRLVAEWWAMSQGRIETVSQDGLRIDGARGVN